MKLRLVLLGSVLCALGISTSSLAVKLNPGDPAPPLRVFRWLKGVPVTRFERGKFYVVDFWATWCAPCKASIPYLSELAKKYAGKVTFTGINISESPSQKPGGTSVDYLAAVRKYVESEGRDMAYNIGADDPAGTLDATWMNSTAKENLPTAVVVGRDGTIAWIGRPMDGLDKALGQMVAGKFDYAAERKIAIEADVLEPFKKAIQEHRIKDALAVVDKVAIDHPEYADDMIIAKFEVLAHSDPASAISLARSVAEGEAKSKPTVLNSIAWAMVDDEDAPAGMDYQLAEALAAQAVALLKPDTRELANTLDTLALAQFKCGKRGDAIATQERAISVFKKTYGSDDPEELKTMKARLAKYTNAS